MKLTINIKVSLNFFCECHGKACRDQHFSYFSTFIRNAQYADRIVSTENLLAILRDEQEKSNKERAKNGLKEIKSIYLGKYKSFTILFHASILPKYQGLSIF